MVGAAPAAPIAPVIVTVELEDEMQVIDDYKPKIGDAVAARRRVKSKIYHNLVVGPVVEAWDTGCRIVTNEGTDIEGDFQFFNSDWHFQFLHPAN